TEKFPHPFWESDAVVEVIEIYLSCKDRRTGGSLESGNQVRRREDNMVRFRKGRVSRSGVDDQAQCTSAFANREDAVHHTYGRPKTDHAESMKTFDQIDVFRAR